MSGILSGFKAFVMRGNLIELAVAFVIGAAFATLMQALVADLVTPIVAAIFGEPSFDDLSFSINGSEFLYGDFLNALLTFVSVAAAIYFLVVVPYERLQAHQGVTAETKACEHCLSTIPVGANRCAYCAQTVATSLKSA
jgi:large conductance mechanosensitive channel